MAVTCPYCGKPAMSLLRKCTLGPDATVPCASCGAKVGVPWGAVAAAAPIALGIVGAVRLPAPWSAASAIGGLLAYVALQRYAVPLVGSETLSAIQPAALPGGALLGKYASNAYTDCFMTEVPGSFSHAEYVEAFYTTAVFKLERLLLAGFLSKPSSDAQARQLATGQIDSFAAWNVEARSADQLLMCDLNGRTRSWLMVAPVRAGAAPATRLYFGSAVVPVVDKASGHASMGPVFASLLGFHKLYSRVLLRAARSRLARRQGR